MKTFIISLLCLLTLLFSLVFSQTGAGNAELIADYVQNISPYYKVTIQPAGGMSSTLYDKDFKPVTNPQAYVERALDKVFYNAVWDVNGGEETNGTVYYGKYKIRFVNQSVSPAKDLPGSPVYIDFRDADYTDQYNFYFNQFDFFVYYDTSSAVGDSLPPVDIPPQGGGGGAPSNRVYFRYTDVDTVANTIGIWQLRNKSQNTSRFMNFQTKVTGLLPYFPVNITVGSTNYQVANNESVAIAAGFGEPEPVVVTAQNRKIILPIVYGYRNFSSWKDQSGNILKLFDTTITATMGGDLATLLTAHYKGNYQSDTVTGPTYFDNKTSLTFTCNHATVSGGTYAYDWWIKYDFNNTWQRLGGGLKTKSVMSSPYDGYSFYIKCFLKDYVDTVGVWSNELRVEYTGGSSGPIAFKELNTLSAAENSLGDSYTFGSWWPVNADQLSQRQKISILLPIKETIKDLTHKFRWKESEAFIAGNDSTLLEDTGITITTEEETLSFTKPDEALDIKRLSKSGSFSGEEGSLPYQFRLGDNYPNPFNPSTTISFEIAKPSQIRLTIYNSIGQRVRTLYEGTKSEGHYDMLWDGKNDQNAQVPSGIYIYRLEAGEFTQSKKMTLVK